MTATKANDTITFDDLLARGGGFQYPVPISESVTRQTLLEQSRRKFRLYRPEGEDYVWFIVEARKVRAA